MCLRAVSGRHIFRPGAQGVREGCPPRGSTRFDVTTATAIASP